MAVVVPSISSSSPNPPEGTLRDILASTCPLCVPRHDSARITKKAITDLLTRALEQDRSAADWAKKATDFEAELRALLPRREAPLVLSGKALHNVVDADRPQSDVLSEIRRILWQAF